MRGAEAGDGVDNQQGVTLLLLQQLRNAFDVMAHAGRSLVRLHEDGARLKLQRSLYGIKREGLPVGRADDIDLAAEGLGQRRPALTELACREHKHAVAGRGEVGDGGLHRSGAGTRKNDDVVLGADELFELRENALIERTKLRRAVMNVGRCHRELRGGEKRGGTRRKEARLANHALILARTRILVS